MKNNAKAYAAGHCEKKSMRTGGGGFDDSISSLASVGSENNPQCVSTVKCEVARETACALYIMKPDQFLSCDVSLGR